MSLHRWIPFLALLPVLSCSPGCSYLNKGATADKVIDYLTRGEDDPQPVAIPQGWAPGAPPVVFPSVPGKDFHATVTRNPDGSTTLTIDSVRSGNIDRLAGAALGIGDQAIDRDAQIRAELRQEREFWLALLERQGAFSYVQQRAQMDLDRRANPAPQPTTRDSFREWLELANDPAFQNFVDQFRQAGSIE